MFTSYAYRIILVQECISNVVAEIKLNRQKIQHFTNSNQTCIRIIGQPTLNEKLGDLQFVSKFLIKHQMTYVGY